MAGLPEPQAGEAFTVAGGRPVGRIVSVEPGQQLTGTIMGAFMSYVLVPQDQDTTRLLLKVVMRSTRPPVPGDIHHGAPRRLPGSRGGLRPRVTA